MAFFTDFLRFLRFFGVLSDFFVFFSRFFSVFHGFFAFFPVFYVFFLIMCVVFLFFGFFSIFFVFLRFMCEFFRFCSLYNFWRDFWFFWVLLLIVQAFFVRFCRVLPTHGRFLYFFDQIDKKTPFFWIIYKNTPRTISMFPFFCQLIQVGLWRFEA